MDWEDKYEISDYGNVRNIATKKLLSGDINNCGYHRVILYDNGKKERFFRHRLVAIHFIENPENHPFVNHIDGNKENNHVNNLEWCDQSYNEKHAFANGLKKKTNRPFFVVFKNGEMREYESQYIFAKEIGVSQQLVSRWLNGERNPKNYVSKIFFID